MFDGPWRELLTSQSIPPEELEEIKDGLLRMADAPGSEETTEEPEA